MVATFITRFNETVTIGSNYISYRTRVLDCGIINEFHVKGRKICINSYKQNNQYPTMCVHMATREDAMELHASMMAHWYDEDEETDDASSVTDSTATATSPSEVDDDQEELDENYSDMPALVPINNSNSFMPVWFKTMKF